MLPRTILPQRKSLSEEFDDEEDTQKTADLNSSVTIKICDIDNLKEKGNQIFDVRVKVEFMGKLVGMSPRVKCQEMKAEVNFETVLKFDVRKTGCFDELTANPLLITVVEALGMPVSVKDKKSQHPPAQKEEQSNIIGRCNMDLLPILLGESWFAETIIIEQDKKVLSHEITVWPDLARINVEIHTKGPLIPPPIVKECDVFSITIESLYNILPRMTDVYAYSAGMPLPINSQNFEHILFPPGTRVDKRDVEKIKKWSSLVQFEGRVCNSKYRIAEDACDLRFSRELRAEEKMNIDAPRVEWNYFRRCWLQPSALEKFQDILGKFNCWPVELMMTSSGQVVESPKSASKGKDKGKEKDKDKEKEKEKDKEKDKEKEKEPANHYLHFVAYLDLTPLLYPGVTKVRVASPLFIYNHEDYFQKTGIRRAVFYTETSGGDDVSRKDLRSGTKVSSAKSVELILSSSELNQGDPMFIVVDIELHRSVVLKRSREELSEIISDYIPERIKLNEKVMSAAFAEEHFARCIRKLSYVISEDFKKYEHRLSKNIPYPTVDKMKNEFLNFLVHKGSYQAIKQTIRREIALVLREKCGHDLKFNSEYEFQKFTSDIYIFLIEVMHRVLNTRVAGEDITEPQLEFVTCDDLAYFAKEATENDNFNSAEKLNLERIARDKENADYWFDIAVYFVRRKNNEKAMECLKEVLIIDRNHKKGLLLYAILLHAQNDYYKSEIFFESLTTNFPEFCEGWVCFHIYYLLVENRIGAEITLKEAKYCYEDIQDKIIHPEFFDKALSWSCLNEEKSMFILAATLLLTLNAYKFVESALAQELLNIQGRSSVSYSYYLAVSHYLEERYKDALVHIQEAVKNRDYGDNDYELWCLMGHVYYRLNMMHEAMECYTCVVDMTRRPDDIHLVCLRLGYFYLLNRNFVLAEETYLEACKHSPSPESWLGVGKACYELQKYSEAEEALAEANMLDKTNSITWTYLCLVNLRLERKVQSEQCYKQALKYKLRDKQLLDQIIKLRKKLGYKDQILTFDENETTNTP